MNKLSEMTKRKAYLAYRKQLISDLESGVFSGTSYETKMLKELQELKKLMECQWQQWKSNEQSFIDEWCGNV